MIREAVKGTAIAAAVCSLLAAGAAQAAEKPREGEGAVKCAGINSCKGQGSCAGADNACKSHNACKGMGWVEAKSAKACTDQGGKVVVAKK